jgi:heptosyltransferase-2
MPEVVRGIELDVGHGELGFGRRRALGRQLRGERYTRAIVLPRSAKAALVPWFARVPHRTGFRGEWRYGLLNDVRKLDTRLDQTVKRFISLGQERAEQPLESLDADLRPRFRADPDNLSRLRTEHALTPGARLIALMPGAEYGVAKRWPAAYYGEVAATLAGAGADLVVLGSAKEREIGDAVAAAATRASAISAGRRRSRTSSTYCRPPMWRSATIRDCCMSRPRRGRRWSRSTARRLRRSRRR